jgi:hypothetical protein
VQRRRSRRCRPPTHHSSRSRRPRGG